MTQQINEFSIVIPAKNEAENLQKLLPELISLHPAAEILVVNDGSTDATEAVCVNHQVKVISHPYSKGNGAAIKTGARNASHQIVVFMDADGQHQPKDIQRLLERLQQGADMVIGARTSESQASFGRLLANTIYNKLSSWISGQKILDLTSGFRVVYKNKFSQFLYLLPNGFSYPTTSTMAFFRAGYSVEYISIEAGERLGKSHINIVKDGLRFLVIIFKIGTLYSPLKIFLPFSFIFFLIGVVYYIYTYFSSHSFTNMGVVLFTSAIIIFLIGLVSEQITALIYKDSE